MIENPAEGSTSNTGNFTLSGTAEAGATVEIFEGNVFPGTTSASAGGNWSKALTGVVDGSHSYTARATDAAANTSAASISRTIVVDTAAPNTTIGTGPAGSTASTGAIFSFSADDPAATFECKLDAGSFTSCASPKSYNGLAETSHTFSVRATDLAGNTDPTPATRTWTVDVTPPAAPVITAPANGSAVATSSVTLSGTAEPGIFVEVFEGSTSLGGITALPGGTWSKTLTSVADGPHTYDATANDNAGNASPVSNTVTVTVDTTAPNTTISSAPATPTNATGASFAFSSNEAGSSFECQLDGSGYSACSSPKSYTGLSEGSHTFQVPRSMPWDTPTRRRPHIPGQSTPRRPRQRSHLGLLTRPWRPMPCSSLGRTRQGRPSNAASTEQRSVPARAPERTSASTQVPISSRRAQSIPPATSIRRLLPTAGRSHERFGHQASPIPPARGCGP